jgi:aspartyl protease family protein
MMVANLLRPSWMAAATFGLMGIVSPGGGETPLRRMPAPDAPTVGLAAPGDERLAPTRAIKSDDGLFYVTARVNGAPVRFVVDTGANVVVLTGADARRAGITPARHGSQQLETASGGSAMTWATLDEVEIAGQTLTHTRAAIVADGLKMSLLGQNALSRLNSVTLRGNRLELR